MDFMAGSDLNKHSMYDSMQAHSTIRLLRLPLGNDPSGFDGHLVSFALDPTTCPEFNALSYTWGSPPTRSKSIDINGCKIAILDTLCPFLKLAPSLQEYSSETWWWIDSICINQQDEEEKRSQMEIMGTIYQMAKQTVVWLGEEIGEHFPDESRDCTGAIDQLYHLLEVMDITRKACSLEEAAMMAIEACPRSGVDWTAIERLMLRPWWRRVWTLQEFLIGNDLQFYCGSKSISRWKFQEATRFTWACKGWDGNLTSSKAFYGPWNRRRMHQWYGERKRDMGLIAILAYIGDCQATHERDRIYSLLGVAKDADMIGPLDLKSTVEEVYTNLVKSFFEKYNSLDIICYSHLFNNPGTKTKRLPSWVPDWRAHVEGKVIPVMASQGSNVGTGNFRPGRIWQSDAIYRASGDMTPRFNVSDDLKIFTCSGIVLDRIDGLGGSTHNDDGRANDGQPKVELSLSQSTSEQNHRPVLTSTSTSDLMATLSRCIVLNRKDRYLADNMLPNLFQTDFETYCRTMLEAPDSVPEWFRKWFLENRSLIIQGRTLEEHCRATPVPENFPWEDFSHGTIHKFYCRFVDTVITMARRLCITETGYLGMAASRAIKGDLVCVLFGCSIPVLLRPQSEGKHEFIGECYLDGFMNGEALHKESEFKEMEFQIA